MSRITLQHLIVALSLLIVSGTFFGYALYEVRDNGKTLSEQVTVLAKEQAQEDSYYRLQGIFERTKDDRAKINNYFLGQGSETIDFLNRVETLAPQAGVNLKIDSLDEVKEKKTGETKSIDVRVTFTGRRANVEQFVKILERLPYFSQVTAVSLRARASDDWQASVSMKIFFTI
ncbi:MAG: hypothetical protein RLZZ480_634 [Candidatus Parcubacteria bacterium]|jgi:hypothetical protein